MKRPWWWCVGLGCALFALTPVSEAVGSDGVPSGQAANPELIERVHLLHELGVSLAYQAPLSFEKRVALGGGATYTLHYLISTRSALGVSLAFRAFPSPPFHFALGYGLAFTHHLKPHRRGVLPEGLFFRYGLLLQMNILEGREGSSTDHDTLLAVGYDFSGGAAAPFLMVGYHLTQVRSFDVETLWWPYTDLVVGLQF